MNAVPKELDIKEAPLTSERVPRFDPAKTTAAFEVYLKSLFYLRGALVVLQSCVFQCF